MWLTVILRRFLSLSRSLSISFSKSAFSVLYIQRSVCRVIKLPSYQVTECTKQHDERQCIVIQIGVQCKTPVIAVCRVSTFSRAKIWLPNESPDRRRFHRITRMYFIKPFIPKPSTDWRRRIFHSVFSSEMKRVCTWTRKRDRHTRTLTVPTQSYPALSPGIAMRSGFLRWLRPPPWSPPPPLCHWAPPSRPANLNEGSRSARLAVSCRLRFARARV